VTSCQFVRSASWWFLGSLHCPSQSPSQFDSLGTALIESLEMELYTYYFAVGAWVIRSNPKNEKALRNLTASRARTPAHYWRRMRMVDVLLAVFRSVEFVLTVAVLSINPLCLPMWTRMVTVT
jgi:hypothetical protein